MRNYLFEGRTVETKEWVRGSLITDDNHERWSISGSRICLAACGRKYYEDFCLTVDPATVRQSTGKHDNVGHLIFENYIIKDESGYVAIVKYDSELCKYYADYFGTLRRDLDFNCTVVERYEVPK